MKNLNDYNVPIFWAEGLPGKLDKEKWEIEISGLLENPVILKWKDLINIPSKTVKTRLTSVTRWSIEGDWTGIHISEIIKLCKTKQNAKFVRVFSYRNL